MHSITFIDYLNNSGGYNIKVDNTGRQILVYSKEGDLIDVILFAMKLVKEIRVIDLFSNEATVSNEQYHVFINNERNIKYLWFGRPKYIVLAEL